MIKSLFAPSLLLPFILCCSVANSGQLGPEAERGEYQQVEKSKSQVDASAVKPCRRKQLSVRSLKRSEMFLSRFG